MPEFCTLRTIYFYPRPPRGGRLSYKFSYHADFRFLSTPSARRATFCTQWVYNKDSISIHALREEGDGPECPASRGQLISIHALREEGDDL